MADSKKTIRRIEPVAQPAFDEQLWPTNVALLVLAGITCGLVVLAGGFDDPRLLYNGWIRLTTLAATLVALAVAANTYCPRRARRLQAAVLVSLVLHVLLAVFLYDRHLRAARVEEPLHHPAEVEELAPQVVEVSNVETTRPLEQPVPVSVDNHTAELVEASRREPATAAPVQSLTATEPQAQLPSAIPPERVQQRAAPHQSQTQSRLSRQTREEVVQASPLSLAGEVERRPAENVHQLRPAPTAPDRRTTERLAAQTDAAPPTESVSETATASTRPSRDEQSPQPTQARSQLARDVAAASAATPSTVEELPDASRVADALPSRPLEPRTESVSRRDTADRIEPSRVEATPSVAVVEDQPRRVRPELPAEPAVNVARVLTPNRERLPAEIATDATQINASRRPSPLTTETARQDVDSQPTTVARSIQQDPTADPRVEPRDVTGGTLVIATREHDSRQTETNEPSIKAQSAGGQPRRTLQPADRLASPTPAEVAQAASSNLPKSPALEPAQLAMERAAEGIVGGESGRNLADDLPSTPQQSAPQPSSAARRPTATQRDDGPALSPSSPVRIARAISEADAPATGAAAAPVETAEAAGAAQPSRVVASSAATIERRRSAAPTAQIVAAEGASSADLGSEQRVPDTGQRRAGGGGEPQITLAAAAPRRTDSSGGGPQAALDAQVTADVPSAPPEAGQEATPRSLNLDAANTPGGRAAPATIVHTRLLDGGPADAASAGEPAPSDVHRQRIAAAAPRLEPGGGLSSPRRRPASGAQITADTAVALATPAPLERPQAVSTAARPAPGEAATVARAAGPREDSARRRDSATRSAAAEPSGNTGPVVSSLPNTGRRPEPGSPQRVAVAGTAPRSTVTAALPQVETSPADLPIAALAPSVGASEAAETPDLRRDATSPIGRRQLAVAVDIEAPLHQGGLAIAPAEAAGSPDRRAQPQSELVRVEPDRFLQRRAASVAAIGGDVRAAAPAFSRRAQRKDAAAPPAAGQPSAKTEAAIELGLVYLARHQRADGRWSLANNGVDFAIAPQERPQLRADTAATGLALLAFLGAGYDHLDDKYHDVVERGLRFLITQQKADGDLYIEEDARSNQSNHFYSHGIAAIALCEAYGMTGDAALREPAQRAIDFIVATQHPVHGGWRYSPGGTAYSSDLSVTGWQVMALKSGELAGLKVPEKTYDEVRRMVQACVAPDSGGALFVYNPWTAGAGEQQQEGALPSTVMTSVGLLMELYLGKNRDDDVLQRGADHLLANLPSTGGPGYTDRSGRIGNPLRDTYYWYYATQVMFHMKGDYWRKWNETLHPLLVNSQSQTDHLAGSWNPRDPVPDQWAPQAGRLYVTAMNLLSLEVYYRHLPLYDETGR